MSRLEALKELLKKDRKSQRNQQYWQNTLNITEHLERFGNPPISERFAKVEIRR